MEVARATRYGGNGKLFVEQIGSEDMGVVFTIIARSALILALFMWDPTLHLCTVTGMIGGHASALSGWPSDHSTESVAMEIYHQCASEELVLAAFEGAFEY